MKNKFVWIENVKSFSGRHKINGENGVGSLLWFPDFFAESEQLTEMLRGEKVYHLLNLTTVIGRSIVSSECFKAKYKSKSQKRVAFFESAAKGVKRNEQPPLLEYCAVKLEGYAKVNEPFLLEELIKDVCLTSYEHKYKDEIDALIINLLDGKGLVKISFSLWLFILSIREPQIKATR